MPSTAPAPEITFQSQTASVCIPLPQSVDPSLGNALDANTSEAVKPIRSNHHHDQALPSQGNRSSSSNHKVSQQ